MKSEIERASPSTDDLPPCPYCGTPGPTSAGADLRWVVACVGCPGKVVGHTRTAAENAWRLRAAPGEQNRY
jgi:hypothetical protein